MIANRILIIDNGISNISSVYNAVEILGKSSTVLEKPEKVNSLSHIILPGVGSFDRGIKKLVLNGWDDYIYSHIEKGVYFLGICLGMQLLATKGYEKGNFDGLNLIKGKVIKIEANQNIRIPHIGWNDVFINRPDPITLGISQKNPFYFVHSYVFELDNLENKIADCEYGKKFSAIINKDNIYGTQFHPEKSQKPGIKLLDNFLSLK